MLSDEDAKLNYSGRRKRGVLLIFDDKIWKCKESEIRFVIWGDFVFCESEILLEVRIAMQSNERQKEC